VSVATYEIVVLDSRETPNRRLSARELACKVPVRVARNWQKERYKITKGLKRQVRENVN
jgi:hypothetical protein